MHGNPLSKFDNRNLWQENDFRKFGIVVEAYLSLDFEKIYYFSDTGRNWNSGQGKVYDKIKGKEFSGIPGTAELPQYIKSTGCSETCILTHPNRWTNRPLLWFYNLCYDTLGTTVKRALKGGK